MLTLQALREQELLTEPEFREILAWLESPLSTQEAVQQMPGSLWSILSNAAMLFNLDETNAPMH